ncbi:phosphatidylethanolamine N-methyltransferase [Vanrija albida]|uniref:Phosphatidylethanolamine N-methyltransferase n=1 Tax=Vanrija albida TaxID=181172 RepID=A0ABR3Q7Z7_9TREE
MASIQPPSTGGDTTPQLVPEPQAVLRNRKAVAAGATGHTTKATSSDNGSYRADDEDNADDNDDKKANAGPEVTWGKTPDGKVFRVPTTHSFVHTLLHTFTRSSLTRWTTISLVSQPVLFFLLAGYPTLRSVLFLVYFAFWRAAYDFGFAWVLRRQSEQKWVVRTLRQWGWLDTESTSGGAEGREWAKWWKRELEMKVGEGYTWESVPQEYNSWLIFRQLVDIVLLNDFVSYSLFAWANLNFPANQGVFTHILRWVFGWALIAFNLWVKMDAHRVVKDYAWYWGDAFWLMVMQHDLVFDGVYEIAPHPMYSVGYAGYYGLSIVVGSYSVLFVSLAAHAAQFAFLLWFENPHIERTYGGEKKPLAARVPLELEITAITTETTNALAPEIATPAATDGETENEAELADLPEQEEPLTRAHADDSFSVSTVPTGSSNLRRARAKSMSVHDLTQFFFRKPTLIFDRLDIFRASDFALVVLVAYAVCSLVPALPDGFGLAAHFLHALAWRAFHSYGLGLLLHAQSKTRWLVRHYLNNYPYPVEGNFDADEDTGADKAVVKRATEEAFQNWQIGYNISLVMTYVSFIGLAWKTYHLPSDWTVSGTILRHVLGAVLIALHGWSAASIREVLGDFGWFYSDFFLFDQVPSRLAYTGIYRFLNNPERSLGGAAFLGLALISNSRLVFALAVFSHLSHWWFLSFVEGPHMQRLYGDRLRKDGGLTKTVKSMAGKTLGRRRSIPNIKRYVDEVRDSIEKVEVKMTEVVEDLIESARPRLVELANDTKNLIQSSRERMTVTRVAKDISEYDTSRYSINLASSSSSSSVPRYHVGQPIRVSWTAPSNHSRKDWIGIYRVGAVKSELITNISSMGKWVPIFEEEYVGSEQTVLTADEEISKGDAGTVTFRGNRLPWAPGQYELRYHHGGKHNVMSMISPIEIFVSKPSEQHSYRAVRDTVLNIVVLALNSNPSLVPRSAKQLALNPNHKQTNKRASRALSQSSSRASGLGLVTEHPTPVAALREASAPVSVATSASGTVASTRATTPLSASASDEPTSPKRSFLCSSAAMAELAEALDHDAVPPGSPLSNQDPLLDDTLQDPDDFVVMDEEQSKRITKLIEWAFDVELNPDVVIADANVGALARRVLGARNLIDGSAASSTSNLVGEGS